MSQGIYVGLPWDVFQVLEKVNFNINHDILSELSHYTFFALVQATHWQQNKYVCYNHTFFKTNIIKASQGTTLSPTYSWA